MTQQGDTTSQQPGTSEPAPEPYWPSPYLAQGQLVPEAYPAPARPGQPAYGAPDPRFWPGPQGRGRGLGFRRPVTPGGPVAPDSTPQPARPGQPGQGQAGQPGLALPAGQSTTGAVASSTGAAASTGADLALASAWERLLAMSIDWLLILIASFALLHEQMTELVRHFQAAMSAAQAFGPSAEQTAVLNFEKDPVNISALVSYFLMAFLLALAYFWALEALGGATLGKRILGLRVVRAADQSKAGIWATGVRTIVFLLGPAIFTFSPTSGPAGITIISLIGGAFWVADSIVLATDSRKRSLHDKAAGTLVVRKAPPRPAR